MNPVQNRSFLGAIAATIRAVCAFLIGTIAVADDGVAMASKAVKVARKKQAADLDIDMSDYIARARDRAALRQVKTELAMREFIGGDPERQQMISTARANLDVIIARSQAELVQSEDESIF